MFNRLKNSIFIVGSPRSCTTFLGKSLGALPEVNYKNEPKITKFATKFAYKNSCFTKIYYKLAFLALHGFHKGCFAEKTPRNSMICSFLANNFEQSKFIHIIRDPRDVAISHLKKGWLSAANNKLPIYNYRRYIYGSKPRFWVEEGRKQEFENTTELHRIIWEWRRYNEAILEAQKTLPASRYLMFKMEDMAHEPEATANQILDFLDIKNAESRVLFAQKLAQVHSKSIGQWQGKLSASELDLIKNEAGELMEHFGYNVDI